MVGCMYVWGSGGGDKIWLIKVKRYFTIHTHTSHPHTSHPHTSHTHTHTHTHTQVSHHPPMFAMHVEHKDWTFWEEYTFTSKFRGKYAVCYPIGSCHLVFHRTKSHYTWCKVVITVHNIIVGSIWMDQVRLVSTMDFSPVI